MRQLAALSDIEFERLGADLLRAETGNAYERFGLGPDGGIDLRFVDSKTKTVEAAQCKHYIGSSFSQLLAAARQEASKLRLQGAKFDTYRFITSQSLTPSRKEKLIEALEDRIRDPGLIWGAESIEDLLNAHPHVERRHVKLWISSSTQLEQLLNAGTLNRSNDLVERITYALPRYVQTQRYDQAERMLRETGVCLIAGEPGIGKTTLGQMLLLESARQGFETFYVSQDAGEAWEAVADRPQAFYYDDFLGRIGRSSLNKNEDQRLVDLISRAHRDPERTRLILTTREYILRGAVHLYDTFERAELDHRRFLLALEDYSRYERGLVLYNHLYHSPAMRPAWIERLVESEGYLQIVDHKNYNPRIIEFITGHAKPRELEHIIDDDWEGFALASLDHPEEIWKRAFEVDLTEVQQAMLLSLVSFGRPILVEEYRAAVRAHCGAAGIAFSDSHFEQSLRQLELTFLEITDALEAPTVDVANPSVSDFVLNVVSNDRRLLASVLAGAVYFAQPRQLAEAANEEIGPSFHSALAEALCDERTALAEAFVRTFESDEPGIKVTPGKESAWPAELERRLGLLLGPFREVLPWIAGAEAWLEEQASRLAAKWREGVIEPRASGAFYASFRQELPDAAALSLGMALKRGLQQPPLSAMGFEALASLGKVDARMVDVAEHRRLAAMFVEFAEAKLLQARMDQVEIDGLTWVAGMYGVTLDQVYLQEAIGRERQRVWTLEWEMEKRMAREERQKLTRRVEAASRPHPPRPASAPRPGQANSSEALRAMFKRLAPKAIDPPDAD